MVEGALDTASAWFAIVPLLFGLALVAEGVHFARLRKSAGMKAFDSTTAWVVVYTVALLGVSGMCLAHLFDGSLWALLLFSLVMLIFGSVVNFREKILSSLSRRFADDSRKGNRWMIAKDAIILVLASILSLYALETPYNNWVFGMAPQYFLIELFLVLCVLSFFFMLSGRKAWGGAIGTIILFCFGVAQYFIYLFKTTAITPSDLLVLNTALSVSANYDYVINNWVLLGMGFAGASLLVLSFVVPKKEKNGKEGKWKRWGTNIVSAAAIAACLCFCVTVPHYSTIAGVKIDSWFTYDSYKTYGFLTSFVTVAQEMAVEKPQGYEKEATEDLVSNAAQEYYDVQKSEGLEEAQRQFEDEQPVVIAVMNETFSDFSLYDNLKCDYQGPEFFKSLAEESIASGYCSVSAYGGGTCNTEFEFLTGNNMAFFGQGMFPYSIYDFTGVENLAKQFNELGYTTTAMHPNYPSNWSRDVIYEKMGFDTFYSKDDFPQERMIHQEVSDFETYDLILDLIENDDSPQFIFDVTMQNHSGYARGGIPEEYQMDVHPEGIDDQAIIDQLNEYLGCIQSSDDALREFVGALQDVDRPVLLVFFGDHQPAFAKDVNDALFPNEDQEVHEQRPYCSSYLVWANYDVEGLERLSGIDQVSASNLAAIALDAIGAPTSDYQKMLLESRKSIPAFNSFGFQDSEGVWYSYEEEDAPIKCEETLDLLERAQYARFFDND